MKQKLEAGIHDGGWKQIPFSSRFSKGNIENERVLTSNSTVEVAKTKANTRKKVRPPATVEAGGDVQDDDGVED